VRALIRSRAGLPDDRRPALDVLAHEGCELGWAVGGRHGAFALELLAHLGIVEPGADCAIELGGDLGGSFAGPNTPNQAVDSKPFTTSPIAGR